MLKNYGSLCRHRLGLSSPPDEQKPIFRRQTSAAPTQERGIRVAALRNLFFALCSTLMLSSAQAALSPADAQVLKVFGVLPWNELGSPPSNIAASNRDSFNCIIQNSIQACQSSQWPDFCILATDIYSASVACAIEMMGGGHRI